METDLEYLGFDYPVVAKKNKTLLNTFGPRAEDNYRTNKRHLLKWLLTQGKNPFKEVGYATETIRKAHYKIERTYRWLWKERESYCWRFSPDDANAFLDYLVRFDDIPEPQVVEYNKAIKPVFKYFNNTTDANIDWSYDRTLKSSDNAARDHFTNGELRRLYEASISYNTIRIPDSEADRDEVRGLLARRFDKPKDEIADTDINRANSWKIPSIIAVTNDLGLRLREVELAKFDWMYPDDGVVRIPAGSAVKSDSAWTCGLSSESQQALGYSIRHGVATMWANNEGK